MKLSQRLGILPVRGVIQGRSLDAQTRNRLWSAFAKIVPEASSRPFLQSWMGELYREIWADFFKEPVDDMPRDEARVREGLKHFVQNAKWYEVYDLIEFVINAPSNGNRERFRETVASVLSEEMAGFRWINGSFVEITDENEILALEEAFSQTGIDRFTPVRAHLATALALLSDRRAPDYRNSIKESISAVEAVAQILTGDPQAELGKALKLLRTEAPVHGALKSALMSLYGYTSDADGIRHALTEEAALDGADAKFMLVACSAFAVYLIQKAGAIAPVR